MALVDLLDKIQSFDYNQVGKPQSFEANGKVVTGQQSFDRPLETPLPIQEGVLGFGPRSLLSNPQGVDFFSNGYVNGFVTNKSPETIGPGTTDFVQVSDDATTYSVLAQTQLGDVNYEWPGPVNFFNKDEEHPFVNGFILNKGISGNGPGTSDFKFLSPDLSIYTVTPRLEDFGGNVYKWDSFDTPSGVNFFFGDGREDDVATGFTTNVKDTQFVNINDEGSVFDYKPNIPNTTYSWVDKDTPYLANFLSDDKVPGFNKEVQLSKNFQPPAVSSQLVQKSISGGVYSSNSYLWSQEYFDFINDNTGLSGIGSDTQNFQQSIEGTYNLSNTSVQFRTSAARIDGMTIDDSNLVVTNTEGDATPVGGKFIQDRAVKIRVDSSGEVVSIPAGKARSMQYPTDFTGRTINTEEGSVKLKSNRLKAFAEDRFEDDDRTMLIPVNGDGEATNGRQFLSEKDQGIKGIQTYTDYIQKMSLGNSQPFIVRKIGNDWGLGGDNEGFFEAIGDFTGELLGGFVRTTGAPFDSITGRIGREVADLTRKGKYLLTSDGFTWGLQQLFLQANNRTIETRFWNPLSVASNSFVNIKRHVGGLGYQDSLKDPAEQIGQIIKNVVPGFLHGTVDKILGGDKEGSTLQSRIQFQAKWRTETGTPEALGPASTNKSILDGLSASADELESKFKLSGHNPNHFFRVKFPIDPYKGPDGQYDEDSDALRERLLTGAQGTQGASQHTTHTFSNKVLERDGVSSLVIKTENEGTDEEKAVKESQKDYRYLSYGQIKSVANSPQFEYENIIKKDNRIQTNTYTGNSPGQAKAFSKEKTNNVLNTNDSVLDNAEKDIAAIMANSNAKGNFGDDINAFSLSDHDREDELDWIQLSFETPQTLEGKTRHKYLQFRASINSINESVTPEYNEQRYLGRPDKYYTYSGVDRDINIDFTLYPKTAAEFPFLIEKLNYLVGLCYPEYNTSGFMIAPFTRFTLGNMFEDAPGYISSLQVNVQENTTWEFDMFEFPKHITCALTYRYIGKYLPHKFGKHYEIDWLDIDKTNPGNLGSTLSNDDHSVNRSRSGGSALAVSGKDLTKIQEGLGINIPKTTPAEAPAESTTTTLGGDGTTTTQGGVPTL